jgi:hypothetical protein
MTPRDNDSVNEFLHDRHPGMRASQAVTERGQSTVDHALRTDIGAHLIASCPPVPAPNVEIRTAAHVVGAANRRPIRQHQRTRTSGLRRSSGSADERA